MVHQENIGQVSYKVSLIESVYQAESKEERYCGRSKCFALRSVLKLVKRPIKRADRITIGYKLRTAIRM